jgi:hypothetical protein
MGLRLRARQLELQGNVGETLPQRGGLVAAHPQTDVVNVFVIPRFDVGRSNGALANTAEAVEGNGSQSWFVSSRSWSQQDPIEFFEDVGSAEEAGCPGGRKHQAAAHTSSIGLVMPGS